MTGDRLAPVVVLGADGPVSFTVAGAEKDAWFIAAAGRRVGADTALIDAVHGHLRWTAESGHDSEDMATVIAAHRRNGSE